MTTYSSQAMLGSASSWGVSSHSTRDKTMDHDLVPFTELVFHPSTSLFPKSIHAFPNLFFHAPRLSHPASRPTSRRLSRRSLATVDISSPKLHGLSIECGLAYQSCQELSES